MKKEVMDAWVAALRSGKYKQGTRKLKRLDRFCCLGVLCDVSEKDQWKEAGDESYHYGSSSTNLLPPLVTQWAGMRSDEGHFAGDSLVSLNDSGKSFSEIADVIEINWKKL